MSIPGVQNPHWTPPASRKARWSALGSPVGGEPLDRRHAPAGGLEGEVGARVHRAAVEQHHARAAFGVVAALLGPGQAELPDRIEERVLGSTATS